MAIQLFVPKFRVEECLAEIRECLEKGWTGLGYKTIAFEEDWKKYTGLSHAHFLNSNTVGLQLALEVLGRKHDWQAGDEVIATPLTFVSSNHAIVYNDLKPVFADVDDSLCMDPQSIREKITERTRAVMFVGLGGNTGKYAEVVKLCREKGIAIILDAAHMAGTRVDGRHVGHDADVTVFSFQAVKNLPTADSGMICFSDPVDDEEVRKLSWLGINKDTYARTASQGAYKWMYDVERVGYKFHGNSIMAAIGLVQLRYLDQDNAYRRQLAQWYRQCLSTAKNVKLIPMEKGIESATHLFQVRVLNRDELMMVLNENEIYPGVHYRDNTEYTMYSYGRGSCPNAAKASAEILSLPMHMGVTHADVQHISSIIAKYAK